MTKEDIFRNLQAEFDEFLTSRRTFPFRFPYESALEYQHGLNHLCVAAFKRKDNPERLENIRKATGHIHRAHLDFLKVWLHEQYKALKEAKHPAIWPAGLGQCPLKMAELYSLGQPDRTGIFAKYRELMRRLLILVPDSTRPTPILRHSIIAAPDAIKVLKNIKELYWEWAQLEAMFASLAGERLYNCILEVIRALENGDAEETIFKQSTMLYHAFIVTLLKMPKPDADAAWLAVEISQNSGWLACEAIKKDFDECGEYLKAHKEGRATGSHKKFGSPDQALDIYAELMREVYAHSKPLVQIIKRRFFTDVELECFNPPV